MDAAPNLPYRLKPHLLLQRVADETVVLDPDSGRYYTLDEVATRMIELFTSVSLEEALATMVEEYDTDVDTVRADLEALLESMAGEGLVERDPES